MLVDLLIVLAKILVVYLAVLNGAAVLTWLERKQSALIQDRIGPNRASIFGLVALGLFQPLADAIKMILKEDFIPTGTNRLLHTLSPFLVAFAALVSFAVIPFGDDITVTIQGVSKVIPLQILSSQVGLLYIFGVLGIGVYGVVLAGWVSKNKWAELGGLRATAQVISYEVTLGLTVMGALLIYQSLDLQEITRAQGELLWGWLPKWGIFMQPLGFVLFLVATTAENKRTPFDVPEGESEIIGYFIEYSGMKFGMFYMAEFMEIILFSCLISILFFGGWQVPYLMRDGFHFPGGAVMALNTWVVTAMQVGAFTVKVFSFCFLSLMIRWTVPRFRYDQILRLGWQMMLPVSLLNLLLTAIVVAALNQ